MKVENIFFFILDNLDKLPMLFAYAALGICIAAVAVLVICIVCQLLISEGRDPKGAHYNAKK